VAEWRVGELLEYEGRLYQVTKWVELRPVRLERGGSVGEWQVWGRRISARRLRRQLADAADRIRESGG